MRREDQDVTDGKWTLNLDLTHLVFSFLGTSRAVVGKDQPSSFAAPAVAGIRGMVSLHGVLNALVVAPCFLLAVTLDTTPSKPKDLSHEGSA